MIKNKLILLLLILPLISLIFPKITFAEEKINKFGIHILEPSDLPKAQELVNSSGGDWGWVTVVIRDDDMNLDKWQGFMDECREKHLVPLVRIATHLEGENWAKPNITDSAKWLDFLGNLNWPTENQYVIVFNEPNQAKEWGGEINPKEYAKIFSDFSAKFKVKSLKFKILNAGLDLAAPNGKNTMEAFKFMQEMNFEIPRIFEKLDGWTSHSYPNHGYLGKPGDLGKTSIRGYETELYWLKNYFKTKSDLPVFITETGWPKNSSKFKVQKPALSLSKGSKLRTTTKTKYYDENTVANYLKYAFENVWLKDESVRVVTPFVLNYPGDLFADFSWLDKEGNPYPQFDSVKNLSKINWWPKQETKYELIQITLPPFLPANTTYKGRVILKNIGQSIWGEREQFIISALKKDELVISDMALNKNSFTKPKETAEFEFTIKSGTESGNFEFTWGNLPWQELKVYPASVISRAEYGLWENIFIKLKRLFKF